MAQPQEERHADKHADPGLLKVESARIVVHFLAGYIGKLRVDTYDFLPRHHHELVKQMNATMQRSRISQTNARKGGSFGKKRPHREGFGVAG